jgi:flagellar hook-length control protein FliK
MIADGAAGAADARTVELGSKAAIATDGDTTLGRVLTRAAIAADARDVSAVPDDSSDSTPPATAAPTVAVKSIATPSAAITLFIKQFETALNADSLAGTPKLTPDDTPAATSLLPQSGHAAAAATQAFSPSVAPFTIERANVDAGSAPPAAASPADHSGIADQVLRGAFMRNVGQSSELRLTLAPSSLGDVTVKLVVNAGNVTAHVIAETPEVRDALVAAQPQLTKSLTDAGLKLTGFSVDLSGNGAGFAQQNNQPQNGNRSRSAVGSVETDDASDETLLEAIPSFGPSNVAGRNVRGYNYLA